MRARSKGCVLRYTLPSASFYELCALGSIVNKICKLCRDSLMQSCTICSNLMGDIFTSLVRLRCPRRTLGSCDFALHTLSSGLFFIHSVASVCLLTVAAQATGLGHHILQNALVTSNKMVHRKGHHLVTQHFIPFHTVCSVLLRVLASKTIE